MKSACWRPKTTDDFTGYRYYADGSTAGCGAGLPSREGYRGFGLAAIGEILKSYDNPQSLSEFLSVKIAEVRAQADETAQRLLLLETAVKRTEKG